ncbi:hypothetical protein [Methylomicrobium lacus]|uniref:hypothetical protein n=1 Tax=Methylomicrobium lacus TaxID=136992 RepID=UPI00045E9D56|nr:hypothetical protein [Methylomicrobium lacus]
MNKIYFVGKDGEVRVSKWDLFGNLRFYERFDGQGVIDGPVVFGVGGEISVQTLPMVKGKSGNMMLRRKIKEFSGSSDLAISIMIGSLSENNSAVWCFAKMDSSRDFSSEDMKWWVMGVENIAELMGWTDQIVLFELHGSRHLVVIDYHGVIVGYHDCAGADLVEIGRVIQSWLGRRWGGKGIITIDCEWNGAQASSWLEIGAKFMIDRPVVSEFPEVIFCHPKIIRSSPNFATEEMRRSSRDRRIGAFFYTCAIGVAIGSLWFAGGLYRSGVANQDAFFRVEEERRALVAKIDTSREVLLGNEAFLRTALTVADSISGAPSLQDGFQVIANAGLGERINLEKISIVRADDRGGSVMTMFGTVTPVFQSGKVYSATLKFLQGFCNLLSEKNPAIVESAKIETLGFIVGDSNASITEPAASLTSMPFQILVSMRRAI